MTDEQPPEDLGHAGAVVDKAIEYMVGQNIAALSIASALLGGAMAVLAGIPIANARTLIHDAGSKGLVSLYEQTGLPPRLLPAVRVALSVLRGTELDGGEHDKERYRSRVITRILTQFEDLPQEDLEYLLDRLGDVLTVTAS